MLLSKDEIDALENCADIAKEAGVIDSDVENAIKKLRAAQQGVKTAELKWILLSEELPKKDGLYAISYNGKTWRQGIWKNIDKSFNESYGGWTLENPVWWAEIPPPNADHQP